ncbi:hypothetical protein SANTM175S_01658 [Streptomyces antimycoticus]
MTVTAPQRAVPSGAARAEPDRTGVRPHGGGGAGDPVPVGRQTTSALSLRSDSLSAPVAESFSFPAIKETAAP